MNINSIILLLIICLLNLKAYTQDSSCTSSNPQDSKISLDKDAMNWELSHDFMNETALQQGTDCALPITIFPSGMMTTGTNTVGCGMVVNYPYPDFSYSCPGIVASCDPPSGSFFPTGTTRVTCTFTQNSNIQASASFNMIVVTECPYECPEAITLDNTSTYGLYHAADTVSASDATTSGTNVFFKAGNIIELQNGFSALPDTDFSAEIEDCQ